MFSDWPEEEQLDVECDAARFGTDDDWRQLVLACHYGTSETPFETMIQVANSAVDAELEGLVGLTNLRLSFFNEVYAGFFSASGTFSLRDPGGELLLLADIAYVYEPVDTALGMPAWGEPTDAGWDEWGAPFAIVGRDVGCAPLWNGWVPWALEIDGDDGPQLFYHRSVMRGVRVGGRQFDIVVPDAYLDTEFQGNGPPGVVMVMVIRSLPP